MKVFVCTVFFFSSRRRHTRCALVAGVQTCALPISPLDQPFPTQAREERSRLTARQPVALTNEALGNLPLDPALDKDRKSVRVGKEGVSTCRSRWSPYHSKKTNITSNNMANIYISQLTHIPNLYTSPTTPNSQ